MTWWPPASKILRSKSSKSDVPPSHEEWMKNIQTKSKTIQKTIPNWTFHEIPGFGVRVKEGSKQFLKIRSVSCVFFVHRFWQLHLLSELHVVSMLKHLKIEAALELNMFMTFHVI